jgi:hypothetical protein
MKKQSFDIAAVIAAELMDGPRSLKALCLSLGVRDRSTHRVRIYVEAYQAQGLVYIHSWWRNQYPLFAWQPTRWANPNAPQPLNRAMRDKRDAEIRRQQAQFQDKPLHKAPQAAPKVANSVFALGAMG